MTSRNKSLLKGPEVDGPRPRDGVKGRRGKGTRGLWGESRKDPKRVILKREGLK